MVYVDKGASPDLATLRFYHMLRSDDVCVADLNDVDVGDESKFEIGAQEIIWGIAAHRRANVRISDVREKRA